MHSFLQWAAVGASLASVVACSSGPDKPGSSTQPGQGGAGGGQQGEGGGGASTTDSVCEAQADAIQGGLDAARDANELKHAAIAVETERCGKRTFLSHDPEAEATVTETSLWRLGSITKTFVSAVILNLASSGKLGLDDALEEYVPTFPDAATITVRQLMNHTSGIFNYSSDEEFLAILSADSGHEFTPMELVGFAASHPLSFEPGEGFAYSNTNYILLGLIAENVEGTNIGAIVRSLAFEKAGLTTTFFAGEEPVVGDFTPGYYGDLDVTFYYDPSVAWASAAIVSTPGDLLTWVHALYGSDGVVDVEAKSELTQFVDTNGYGPYGLGVQQMAATASHGNGPGLGHGGTIAGYQAQAFWFDDTKFGLVTLIAETSVDPAPFGALALEALRIR
jgi:D-alanyl-D-alanine carboxypeptidase